MSVNNWEHFFKPEVRSSGKSLAVKGNVSMSRPSDIEIQNYIHASTSFKVALKSDSVESSSLTADCTCPASKKGQLCKHIWATLLTAEEKYPDFFDGKIDLQKNIQSDSSQAIGPATRPTRSTMQTEFQEKYKQKQTDYRKQQYQKQKQRLKDQNKSKNKISEPAEFPPAIESALDYFSNNGFSLRESMTKESIGTAKKKLARIFHPDVGGSHVEFLELNKFADILTKFVRL